MCVYSEITSLDPHYAKPAGVGSLLYLTMNYLSGTRFNEWVVQGYVPITSLPYGNSELFHIQLNSLRCMERKLI